MFAKISGPFPARPSVARYNLNICLSFLHETLTLSKLFTKRIRQQSKQYPTSKCINNLKMILTFRMCKFFYTLYAIRCP